MIVYFVVMVRGHGSWLWFVVMVRVVTNHIFKPHIHYNYLFQSPKNIFLRHKKQDHAKRTSITICRTPLSTF